jgi:hypothetical protein
MAAVVTFVFILAAQYLGYHLGSVFARAVGIGNGVLMMLYSFYLLSVYAAGPLF